MEVETFDGIDLDTTAVAPDGHHYVYLAPDGAPAPNAEQFVSISWEWVASQLQTFLTTSYGEYPTRTVAQLNDFIDTIRSELTMTEYQSNQQEKMELYVRHYDDIHEIMDAFDDGWKAFEREWGTRLTEVLETKEVDTVPNIPDESAVISVQRDDRTERWILKQPTDDWAWIYKASWWKRADTGMDIYERNRPDARVGFLHRLDKHRERALRDHELTFFFRVTPPSPDAFKETFRKRFAESQQKLTDLLPVHATFTGNKANLLEISYDIEVAKHETFFDAYVAALREAVEDTIVANEQLISIFDEIYVKSFEQIGLK